MARTAQEAVDRALQDLKDPDGVTWDKTTYMLPRVGDALAQIVELVPAAYQVRKNLTLDAGKTAQVVPAGTVRIVRPIKNMGTDGATPGRRITFASESQMDAVLPDWHTAQPKAQVMHIVYDEKTPGHYEVFPPPEAALRIECIVSEVPPPPSALANQLPVGDEYFPAVVNYLKYRAHDMQGPRRDMGRAQEYWGMFRESLGLKKATDAEHAPKRKAAAE